MSWTSAHGDWGRKNMAFVPQLKKIKSQLHITFQASRKPRIRFLVPKTKNKQTEDDKRSCISLQAPESRSVYFTLKKRVAFLLLHFPHKAGVKSLGAPCRRYLLPAWKSAEELQEPEPPGSPLLEFKSPEGI